jgi:hypothetical protein
MISVALCKIVAFLKVAAGLSVGIATNFSHVNDPWNPVAYAACLRRDLRETDLVVAHPTLPCRSTVYIYNPRTHRSVYARVGDRGPRHAMVDLAPATTRALRANGWETVWMIPIPNQALR